MTGQTIRIRDLAVTPEKQGADRYIKISYPLRFGRYGEIRTAGHLFGFHPNGEVRTIQGRTGGWLTSAEWLKRTAGNDWQYFSAGGYTGAFNYTGEYYIPCLPYRSNTLFGADAFERQEVQAAFHAWAALREKIDAMAEKDPPAQTGDFLARIRQMDPQTLEERGRRFHGIIGGVVSVLPPDTRHVEYDVIPVVIADGCLYNCAFCRVKSGRGYSVRSGPDVIRQLQALKEFYGPNLVNYNSVFLAQHDALYAPAEMIGFAARKAYEILEIEKSIMKEPRLFMFGSVDAMLAAGDSLFEMLNRLPFHTFINLGLESGDSQTLRLLGKPLAADKVSAAFSRMLEVNRKYPNIEVTANFVIGAGLPGSHLPSILELARNRLSRFYPKGAIYLSPLENTGDKNRLLARFNEFKTRCRLPAYIYLIQRL